MGTANYRSKQNAIDAVERLIYRVPSSASENLVWQAVDRAWRYQETPKEALKALSNQGVDCEGFDD